MNRYIALSMMFAMSACGGQLYLADESLCSGPYCDQTCSIADDCPDAARCILGLCSTAGGSGGGATSADGAPLEGDGPAVPGDSLGNNDNDGGHSTAGDGGPAGTGDASVVPPGDNAPAPGDARIEGGDGTTCLDPDFDGYCACCALGLDCDETNPSVNEGAAEVCNFADDNCNGIIDDNLQTACGDCGPTGPGGEPWCNSDDTPWTGGSGVDPGDLAGPGSGAVGVTVVIDGTVSIDSDGDGFGAVTLASGTVATDFAWAANSEEGTVSRVDTILNREVGRYATTLVRSDDPYRPYVAAYGLSSQCQQPSRTSIDEVGSAYVANRANHHLGWPAGNCPSSNSDPKDFGSVSKVGFLHPQLCDEVLNPTLAGCPCVDRNGNGRIDTSHDYGNPSNGIELPRCVGNRCGNSCIEDADCQGTRYCVRESYPSQATGKCSSAMPEVAPCTGAHCATTCSRHDDCSAAVLTATSDHYCVQQLCSSRPQQPEFLGNDDECLVWTRRIPGNDHNGSPTPSRSKPRSMAIDKHGYIWVGDHERENAYKLNAEGEFVDPIDDATTPVNSVCARTARLVSSPSTVVADISTCLTQRCFFTLPSTCRIDLGMQPYGAVIDSGRTHPEGFGYVWFADTNANLVRVDSKDGTTSPVFDSFQRAYGITIDEHDRVWIADSGRSSGGDVTPNVLLFDTQNPSWDPASAAFQPWTTFSPSPDCVGANCGASCSNDAGCSPPALCVSNTCSAPWGKHDSWRGRGITTELLSDGTSRIWTAFNDGWLGQANFLLAFSSVDGSELTQFRKRLDRRLDNSGNSCRGPVGVGIGFGGKVWVVNQSGESMCSFDPSDLTAELVEVPIGGEPYTYSDFTGNIFRSFTNPQGKYQLMAQACPFPFALERWRGLELDVALPGESMMEVTFRVGNSIPAALLATASTAFVLTGPSEQANMSVPMFEIAPLSHIVVELKFIADSAGLAPILYGVDLARTCIPQE